MTKIRVLCVTEDCVCLHPSLVLHTAVTCSGKLLQEERPFALNIGDLYLHFLSDTKELEEFNSEIKAFLLQGLLQLGLHTSLHGRLENKF